MANVSWERGDLVRSSIVRAAHRTGVDFAFLMDQAKVESGFDATARSRRSSAQGLYQFVDQTWLSTVKKFGRGHGLSDAASRIIGDADGRFRVADPADRAAILALRNDPDAAAAMAAELAKTNTSFLRNALAREPEPVDLYLAHFLGAGGAAKFLKAWRDDGAAPAARLFPAAANANRAIFFSPAGNAKSLSEIRTQLAAKFAAPTERPWPAPRYADAAVPSTGPARIVYLMLASLGAAA